MVVSAFTQQHTNPHARAVSHAKELLSSILHGSQLADEAVLLV